MTAVLAFLDGGGPVMWGILLVGLLMWILMAERALWLLGPPARRAVASCRRCCCAGDDLRRIAEADVADQATRGFAVIAALVAIAPLLGLLGTVGGMIATFDALLRGGRIGSLAGGIGEALLTTQYGLCVAIPGAVVLVLLRRRADGIVLAARAPAEAP